MMYLSLLITLLIISAAVEAWIPMVKVPKTSSQFHEVISASSWNFQMKDSKGTRLPLPILRMSKGRGRKAIQRKETDFLEFLEAPIVPKVDASDVSNDPNEDELAHLVKTIAKAADKRKAEDIKAIRVSKLTATTAFIVIVSGNSRPQNQAIAAAISDDVEQLYQGRTTKSGKMEGSADSGWILLDYGDVMVHVMTPKSRLFYDIEGIWKKGEVLDLSEILVPNNSLGSDDGLSVSSKPEVEEEDPFWT
jgi:ribosome-associated protein